MEVIYTACHDMFIHKVHVFSCPPFGNCNYCLNVFQVSQLNFVDQPYLS